MARGRTRGSALLLALFFTLWARGLSRSLRVGDKLLELLRLCFGPRLRSRESACLSALVSCTLMRTLITMATADCSGRVARALTEGEWGSFARQVSLYALIGVPASAVHAGLKYCTRLQSLLFQRRLSREVNSQYIRGANFYKASSLPQCRIDNVDQRVTADVERFAESAAGLLTTIFKPVLDVILLTMRLGRQLGVHAPAVVIGASLLVAQLKLRMLPDVKRLAQEESELAGLYRNAHARLLASAEEVALFQGGRRERALLDALAARLFRASVQLSRAQLFLGVLDHYLIKSCSPCVAWALQARARQGTLGTQPLGEIVSGFVRTGAQLSELGSAVGHLVQASTKVASLAGITTRVSEVLDAVRRLEAAGNDPFVRPLERVRPAANADADADGAGRRDGGAVPTASAEAPLAWPSSPSRQGESPTASARAQPPLELELLAEWRRAAREAPAADGGRRADGDGSGSDDEREDEEAALVDVEGAEPGAASAGALGAPGGAGGDGLALQIVTTVEGGTMRRVASSQRIASIADGSRLLDVGGAIQFERVAIASPDGQLLVRDLSFCVPVGSNVLLSGPNGCGKSSLVRVLGDLWPLAAGTVTKPPAARLRFVPQRPYLVNGSLRDQLIYPHSAHEAVSRFGACAARALERADRLAHGARRGAREPAAALDELLHRLLSVVDPAGSLLSQFALDEARDWTNTLSGGQKQRVGMARLFYHAPRYAVLDECTSAVSVEVEARIYSACRALGISLFTVSHKHELMRRFHEFELALDGRGGWVWTDLKRGAAVAAATAAATAAAVTTAAACAASAPNSPPRSLAPR